ncbi:TPA: hypothetical protein JIZ05_18265 [Acinetobacter baumannii]|nr:hypothetical protein [Acinetobacter baumannii]HAV4979935.1 hypothetical protein [Acinetobacter baumannii]HAV4983798.1 hypothetical protein [Acinetobacter baumannii]
MLDINYSSIIGSLLSASIAAVIAIYINSLWLKRKKQEVIAEQAKLLVQELVSLNSEIIAHRSILRGKIVLNSDDAKTICCLLESIKSRFFLIHISDYDDEISCAIQDLKLAMLMIKDQKITFEQNKEILSTYPNYDPLSSKFDDKNFKKLSTLTHQMLKDAARIARYDFT